MYPANPTPPPPCSYQIDKTPDLPSSRNPGCVCAVELCPRYTQLHVQAANFVRPWLPRGLWIYRGSLARAAISAAPAFSVLSLRGVLPRICHTSTPVVSLSVFPSGRRLAHARPIRPRSELGVPDPLRLLCRLGRVSRVFDLNSHEFRCSLCVALVIYGALLRLHSIGLWKLPGWEKISGLPRILWNLLNIAVSYDTHFLLQQVQYDNSLIFLNWKFVGSHQWFPLVTASLFYFSVQED